MIFGSRKTSGSPAATGSISNALLVAGFLAFTMMVLLAALSYSSVLLRDTAKRTSTGSTGSTYGVVGLQTLRPLGTRPAHLRNHTVSSIPNQQALTQALWAPGIDHGYVPQGLAFAEGQLLVSAYRSTSPAVSMGPCRVYRMDPDSGKITGYFDLPPACGHAGGLAYAGGGVLILSDTRRLYRIDLEQALADQHADNAITGTLELRGALRGSFAAFVPATTTLGNQPGRKPAAGPGNGPGMFIGAWSTSASKAKGYFLPLTLFDSHNGTIITEANADSSILLGARAQGGAVAPDGSLWLSYSSHDFGTVQQVEIASGKLLASYPLVSGTEDISFDEQGGLWVVSEAGSLRWRSWKTIFPVVFRLDPALLN